jgi:glycosyltransferase 2 family protein
MLIGPREISVERIAILTVIPVAGVLAVATFLVGGRSLVANLAQLGAGTLCFFVLLAMWQNGFRFLRWLIFACRVGVPIGICEGLLFYAAGCGMTLTPGRLGEMLRLWLIERRFGTPYRRSTALYIADRVGDADAYLILLGLSIILRDSGPGLGWSVLGGIAVVNMCLLFPGPVLGALAIVYKMTRRGRKPLVWLRRLLRNCANLFRPPVFVPCLAFGVLGWGAVPVVLMLALNRMGVELTFPSAMTICALASLTGGATLLPGGGGSTEAAMVLLLRAASVPLEAAVTATIATRLAFLWAPVGVGLLTMPVAIHRARRTGPASALSFAGRRSGETV